MSLQASNIYVDPILSSNITNGLYSIENRNASGSDGDAYRNVQDAVNAMSVGDKIILRGGTYKCINLTGNSNDGAVKIPLSKNGYSWEEGHYNSISSFDGEWAILDGENKCSGQDNRSGVIGWRDWDKDGGTDLKYWKFERLEIMNGTSSDGQATCGMWLNGGPFIIRYCYIHDNIASTGGANPCGIKGMVWNNSLVEYCYFSNNGCTDGTNEIHSVTGPQIHSDYRHSSEYWEIAPYDINHATIKNEFRFNLFEDANSIASSGIHHKGRQYLTPKTNINWTYKEYGDRIHHNIFLNCPRAIGVQQDFAQVYSNIALIPPNSRAEALGIVILDPGLSGNLNCVTVYNNTIIYGRLGVNFGAGSVGYVVNPYIYLYNNIIDSPNDNDNKYDIYLGYSWMSYPFDYKANRTDISNNYIYRPDNEQHIRVTRNEGDGYGIMSISRYNDYYGNINYVKSSSEDTDGLYLGDSGSERFKTRQDHLIELNITVGNGGIGKSHPYLESVNLPSYLGATDPNNSNWVNVVLNLVNLAGDNVEYPPEAPQGLRKPSPSNP